MEKRFSRSGHKCLANSLTNDACIFRIFVIKIGHMKQRKEKRMKNHRHFMHSIKTLTKPIVFTFLDSYLDENIRALVFYLEHAKNSRLEFPVHLNKYEGTKVLRFIDVPIDSCGKASPMRVALQASSPDLLLTLLRYGANVNPKDGGMMPIVAILDKLVGSPECTQIHVETCLKILLKTVPTIEMPYKPFTFEHRKGMFIQKYEVLFERGCIKQEQVFGVMDLKHLCRCTIRENLRANYQLPSGINMLKVPKSLKCYIDLMD
ncbi:uncharacterized protein LOC129579131 [Sitodiplosis mosellana]|uniref:uncharacterized protein LOC129579131 n=1 Tax=Sitodiplosis mosellana TaxID=263140 RepID=UPI002444E990|nr:uncharacterized protein LOC129579131 [Sitodiplosis mosellana]